MRIRAYTVGILLGLSMFFTLANYKMLIALNKDEVVGKYLNQVYFTNGTEIYAEEWVLINLNGSD